MKKKTPLFIYCAACRTRRYRKFKNLTSDGTCTLCVISITPEGTCGLYKPFKGEIMSVHSE